MFAMGSVAPARISLAVDCDDTIRDFNNFTVIQKPDQLFVSL